MAKEEEFEHLKKYEKKSKEAENMITHIDLTHMENYAKTAKEVLKVEKDNVEDIRQKDLSKLKESEHQLKFADKLADSYRDSAKEYLSKANKGKEWDLDEFDESLLVKAVYGTSRNHLRRIIGNEKDNFSPDRFMKEYRSAFMEDITQTLHGAAGTHLKDEHVKDIIKYTGIDKIEDLVPDYLNLNIAKIILNQYNHKGEALTRSDIEAIINRSEGKIPEQLLKKKEKEKEKKK